MSKGRFFAALAGFLIVLLAAQVLLGAFCDKLAIPSVFDTLLMEYTHPGIVYVGDSALRARPPEFVLLPDMLAELRPDDTVFGYPLLGADPHLQYEFVRKLLKSGPQPTAVVVGYHPAMMVSQWNPFEEGQDSMLWHARLSCPMLRPFTRPAAVFKFFHVFSRVEEEQAETKPLEDMIAYARGLPPGKGAGDFAHLPPDAVPEGARYVYKMARLLKTHNVPAVLYLSPINIERAERVYGGDQKTAAEVMARYVQEQGERGGIPVHDWMFEGKEDEFEPEELVSVHMLSGLQRRIADKVNAELDNVLPRKSTPENVAPDPANGGTGLRSDKKVPHKASCSHRLRLSPTAHVPLPRKFPNAMGLPDALGSPSARSAIPGRCFALRSLLLSVSKICPVWDRRPRRSTPFSSSTGEPHGCPGSLVAALSPRIQRSGRSGAPLGAKENSPGQDTRNACRRPGITPAPTNKPCKGGRNPAWTSGTHSHCPRVSPTAQCSLFPDEVQRKNAEAASYGQPFMKAHTE